MKHLIKNKILLFEDLIKKVAALKKEGKTVVQSHGIFDLIHPGVIKHLNSAKEQGNVLLITVIKDKDVRMGPGKPIFSEDLRAENVASLSQVDYVCLVEDETPFECVKRIKPDVFARGQFYKDRDNQVMERIFEKQRELYFGQSKIHETGEFALGSSEVIEKLLYTYPEETRSFLKDFVKKYSFKDIRGALDRLTKLKILLIGDGIIDEYHYCESIGKSAKAPIVVNKYLSHEIFAGGAFAIANHIAGICDKVKFISLLGNNGTREEFIKDNLKPNIAAKFFYRDDAPTIVKKRYINQYLNQKLFEVNYLNDNYINKELENKIIGHLKSEVSSCDVILISDFGHGFITGKIINFIERTKKKFAVNTQTNAANIGFNLITKYQRPVFVCLDEAELRWAAQERFSDVEFVAKKILKITNGDNLMVTMGKRGSLGISRTNLVNRTPAFSTKIVDTVGAGDAFFAFTAPGIACGMPLDLVSFIGNAVGALAVQVVGNKKSIEKYELLEFIHALLK